MNQRQKGSLPSVYPPGSDPPPHTLSTRDSHEVYPHHHSANLPRSQSPRRYSHPPHYPHQGYPSPSPSRNHPSTIASSLSPSSALPLSSSSTPTSTIATATTGSFQQRLQDRQRHRDTDRLEVAERNSGLSTAHEGVSSLAIDPWPRTYSSQSSLDISSNATYTSRPSNPFARPVVYDRGTYDRPDHYQKRTNANDPGSNDDDHRDEGGRIRELTSNEADDRLHIGNSRAICSPSSVYPHQQDNYREGNNYRDNHEWQNNSNSRWMCTAPPRSSADSSFAPTESRSISQPHSSSYPRSQGAAHSYLDSHPQARASFGQEPQAILQHEPNARLSASSGDAHNRHHSDSINALVRRYSSTTSDQDQDHKTSNPYLSPQAPSLPHDRRGSSFPQSPATLSSSSPPGSYRQLTQPIRHEGSPQQRLPPPHYEHNHGAIDRDDPKYYQDRRSDHRLPSLSHLSHSQPPHQPHHQESTSPDYPVASSPHTHPSYLQQDRREHYQQHHSQPSQYPPPPPPPPPPPEAVQGSNEPKLYVPAPSHHQPHPAPSAATREPISSPYSSSAPSSSAPSSSAPSSSTSLSRSTTGFPGRFIVPNLPRSAAAAAAAAAAAGVYQHPGDTGDSSGHSSYSSNYDRAREDDYGSGNKNSSGGSHRNSTQTGWRESDVDDPGDMSHNFGTEMPTTVDLKSAIDTCDVLCKFALHFASQDPKEMEARAANEGQGPMDPHHRSNLQIIRNMNSTMLAGLQPSGAPSGSGGPGTGSGTGRRREDDGEDLPAGDNESPRYQQQQQQQQYRRSTDAPMTDSADQDDDEDDDETSPIFGMGPPSSELVHELAKAATSIFQLAIRIKAWVSMTPEQRERDEEINIIRGKRCLFMDGTATMPLPSVDAHSARRQQDEWVSNSQTGGRETTGSRIHPNESSYGGVGAGQQQQQNRFQGPGDFVRMDGAMTNGRSTSQFSTPFGSYTSIASSQGAGGGGMASSMALMEKGLGRVKSRTSAKASGSENGEAPYPKYRKRAKRTHPPGRCLSCDSSDTPEWRRGPDGARTLCNACGLHYAKLLKRQQQQQALQNGAQDATSSNTVTTAALRLSMAQLQGMNFQNRRRPDSLTQGEGVINGAGGEAGASDATTDSNMVVDQDTLQQAPQAPPPSAD